MGGLLAVVVMKKRIEDVLRIKLKHEPDGVSVTIFTPKAMQGMYLGKFQQFSLNSKTKKKPFEKRYMLGQEIIDFYEPTDIVALEMESRKIGLRRLEMDVLG